ncbi:hypothetical protein AQUCO_01000376v1 [Aquilegia coerulea]|uniref:Plastid division protein PDV2 n=1 Tax=Aquilegia coerulea TaxID=218851 RepID=A0A2G5E9M2_AQUCA|nr:hypothetical protein AQUCO_01000376v1 [Aquilegia coerulea]
MERDEISVVLSRVSELRSKITNCIDKATTKPDREQVEEEDEQGENRRNPASVEPDDEAEKLFSIRDALESLEEVLASLQALQQQQRYERETTLAEIDHSRKILLKKIKEYKGEDLEVIHEVSAFASETVEHDDDLLLPPYPSHPHPLILDKGYSSNFPSSHSISRNGLTSLDPTHKVRKVSSGVEKERAQTSAHTSPKGLRFILSVAAKTVLTLVSVVSILSLAGFEPRVGRRSADFKVGDMFQKLSAEEKVTTQCPPGKVLVVENGEARCLVKERLEIPFDPVVRTPNVNYGCG